MPRSPTRKRLDLTLDDEEYGTLQAIMDSLHTRNRHRAALFAFTLARRILEVNPGLAESLMARFVTQEDGSEPA